LAPEFLAAHCLYLRAADTGHVNQIGLSFRPNRGGDVSDVQGTLWLDRRTFELTRLEWSYTNIEPAADAAGAGGHLTFGVLPSGGWVVTEWNLRMPVVVERTSATASSVGGLGNVRMRQQRDRVVRVVEEVGGLVVSVREEGREVWATPANVRMLRLIDAESHTPLVGSLVELRGTTQRSVSDSGGYVALPYVLTGRYSAEIVIPSLVTSAVAYHADVNVQADGVEPPEIQVPARSVILNLACEGQYSDTDRGIVVGSIIASDGWSPTHPVRVRATARGEMRGIGSRGAASTVRAVWTRTDGLGRFRLCGLPWDEEVVVQAPEETGRPGERVVVRRDSPTRLDITLNP
jgi:hypothetical protein